jgi:hypothetical protein
MSMGLSTKRWRDGFNAASFGIKPEISPHSYEWTRRFCAYYHFVAWDCLSMGVHVAICQPNIEVHVPFGFFRIGWQYGPWTVPK